MLGLAKIFYPGMPVVPAEASMETLEMVAAPAASDAPSAPDVGSTKDAGDKSAEAKPADTNAQSAETKPADTKPVEATKTEGAKP